MTESRPVSTITHDAALAVLDAVRAAAQDAGVPVCAAVADPGGNLVAYVRMDGAALLSADIAQNKAYTVVAFNGVPTHEWYDMIKDEPALLTGLPLSKRFVIFGGGVALRSGGQLVGGVGVSGGTAEEDRSFAEAGAAVLSPAAGAPTPS